MENNFFKGITVGFIVGYFFGSIIRSSSRLRMRLENQKNVSKFEDLTEYENLLLQDVIFSISSGINILKIKGTNSMKLVQKLKELGYSVKIGSYEKNKNASNIEITVVL